MITQLFGIYIQSIYYVRIKIYMCQERKVIDMFLNKKSISLGVTLFSAMVLTSLVDNQTVKADATTSSQTGVTGTETKTTTVAPTVSTGSTSPSVTPPTASTVLTGSTSPSTSSTTTTTATTAPVTSPTSATTDYSIPSSTTDATVVKFDDAFLGDAVKSAFGLKPTTDLTVGAIKSYSEPILGISTTQYEQSQNHVAKMTNKTSTPVERLNGLQYLTLLPSKSTVDLNVRLASDSAADSNLEPLAGINFDSLGLYGDFSDASGKKIDVTPLTKANVSKATEVVLSGDAPDGTANGVDNQQLQTLGPWLTGFLNNGQAGGDLLELGGATVTDFSPLKGVNSNANALITSFGDTSFDPTPVYALKGQAVTFTAPKFLGLTGEDLSSAYHYTTSVPQAAVADDDLENLGNSSYKITTPDPEAKMVTYGYPGFMDRSNPDAMLRANYGTNTLEYFGLNSQPLIWQTSPTVTIHYLNTDGTPLTNKGVVMTKEFDGSSVGARFDLTSDSAVTGHTLTSPSAALKGTYTLAPQVIDLVYKALPVQKTTTGTSTTPTTGKTTGPATGKTTPVTTTTTKVSKKKAVVSPASSRESVKIHYVDGSGADDSRLAQLGVKATTTINGKLFYLFGYGQWVQASDYFNVTAEKSGIVRTLNSLDDQLFDGSGRALSYGLAPNTEWKYSRVVSINSRSYYQVATDEFLPVEEAVDFTPVSAKTDIYLNSKAVLYDSKGQTLSKFLASGSGWATDGCAIINGVKMYRVATDEWVSAGNVKVYQPVSMKYRADFVTPVYDSTGQRLSRTLPMGTSWRVDQIVENNQGEHYYRVATNEYVRDYADDAK